MATHVYFDFFGTLVDYDPSIHPVQANAPHAFAQRHGSTITATRASEFWQLAWTELDSAAERSGRECSMRQIADRFRDLAGISQVSDRELDLLVDEYLTAWCAQIRLAPSAEECLRDLAADHTLSVVSNTHHAQLVPRLLERFRIREYFSDVFTSIEIGWRKPHPQIFRVALDRHAIHARDVAFVGDNWAADVDGPRGLGMTAYYVGVRTAERQPTSLAALPALIRGSGAL